MPRFLHICAIAIALVLAVAFCAPASAQFETRVNTPFLWSDDDGGVAIGDFNHDGKMDVALVSSNLQIFLGKGDGTFHAPITYRLGGFLNSITLADFNGDGQIDIAVTNTLSSNLSIFFGNGDGTFQLSATLATQAYPGFITASDFNNDGKQDFVLITDRSVTLFLNKGDGTFGIPKKIELGSSAQLTGLGVGDFNRDGILDLAVSDDSGDGELVILLGDGHGSFTQAEKYTAFVGGVGPIGVGDFRGNGVLDLVVAPYLNSEVNVYLGNGDGTFQPAVSYSSEWGDSVAVADLNGDGKLDLVLSNLVGTLSNGNVFVLLGNGDGTFQSEETFLTGILPDYVAVGDMNGDGMPDIINVDRSGDMFTLLNTGTAYFNPTSPVTFPFQLIGTTSSPLAAQMTNAGTTPITISSVTASGAPFNITHNTCTGSLAPGAQCRISASFTPTVKDSVVGTLSIMDSASSKPQVVELTGPGTFVKFVPSALSFPPTKVGSTSAPQAMQLTNTGSAPLNFTYKIYVGGGYGGNYNQSNTCPKQLAAGASCAITVAFSPLGVGTRNAYLEFEDDGGGSPQQPKLNGTGD